MGSTNSFNTRTIATLAGESTEIFSLSKLESALGSSLSLEKTP